MIDLINIALNAKKASVTLAQLSKDTKSNVLFNIADSLVKHSQQIIDVNAIDVGNARAKSLSEPFIDRLTLNSYLITQMADGVRQVATLADYNNMTAYSFINESGIDIKQIFVPLGVVAVIYESRPNVTIDVASLTLMSGNACILRGGSEAINTNKYLVELISDVLADFNIDTNCVQIITDTSREVATKLMTLKGYIDLLIPRGGKNLIDSVVSTATIPVIETGAGNCHIYINQTADQDMALNIILNAKLTKPSACNAVEKILVDATIAKQFLPKLSKVLAENKIMAKLCKHSLEIISGENATEQDWSEEYNNLTVAIKVVDGVDEAIEHINKYSTSHSEAIIATDCNAIEQFLNGVDSACVYANASTRFSDGNQFGLGAEVGISTQKLHSRGPMGLLALYTTKFIVRGNGQCR